VVQVIFAVGAGKLMSRQLMAESPVPHIDYALAVYGDKAKPVLAILAVLASASLLNSVLAAVPRMLQGMAENGQVFPVLKIVHPRLGTPVVAIAFVAFLPIIGIFWSGGNPDAIIPLTVAASISWILAYIVAQISMIVLRLRHPLMHRPFKAWGFPYVQILAILGMAYVITQSSPSPEMMNQIVEYTGGVLGIFSIIGAIWVKLVMKRGLFESNLVEHR
jgi:amino acid transporter